MLPLKLLSSGIKVASGFVLSKATTSPDNARHAEARWPRSRWHCGEAFGIALPARRTRDAEVQTLANGQDCAVGRYLLRAQYDVLVEYLLMEAGYRWCRPSKLCWPVRRRRRRTRNR